MVNGQRFFSITGFYLWLGSVFGAVCLLPYIHALTPEKFNEAAQRLDLSVPIIIALSLLQSAVILGLVTFSGLWAARKLGLGAPLLDAAHQGGKLPYNVRRCSLNTIVLGVVIAFLIVGLDALFSYLTEPNSLDRLTQQQTAPWKGFLASFNGGITEEIQMRLFVL